MNYYFNIRYEFNRSAVLCAIDNCIKNNGKDYICVADGVILNTANRDEKYLNIINGGIFSICDSSYVPLYIKWLYGIEYQQYCGSQIFMDIVHSRKYRMAFLGASKAVLNGLQENLSTINPDVSEMMFFELPFCKVDDFDYRKIAEMIENDGADIIWVALGAPKQEIFMSKLKPFLKHGVMIAVGAAFKFYSGLEEKRAPEWMLRNHLEFVYRIIREPKKQIKRCSWIIYTLPGLLYNELRRKKNESNSSTFYRPTVK